jgi:hypothetical protein
MNKVILVGASKTLLKNKLGKTIDSFDIVCRMNTGGKPECLTGEYKDIIGSKTNIWLCKHIAWLVLHYNHHTYDELVGFGEYKGSGPKWPPHIKDVVTKGNHIIEKCKKTLNEFNGYSARPTCGILSIFYLLEKFDKISICGFDGFKGGHWYGNRFIANQNDSDKIAAQGFGAHNAIKESEYIEYLIKNNKINRIDE